MNKQAVIPTVFAHCGRAPAVATGPPQGITITAVIAASVGEEVGLE